MKKKFKSILLIDDNAADNRYNQIILEEMNIAEHIQVAETGLEALNMLSQENELHPDLILLDINMPKMNGWEFLEAYKKLSPQKNINDIVVVLTTSMNAADKKKAAQIPEIAQFDIKPLTPDMLHQILEKYLPGDDET